ncbi:MAG: DNA polymerase IV [Butyrivibrio sp.]|uniref:Y-family DNA polymerase n=1 Tax=Butyrivibrio sp. TaxID=28121 RepID=UPI001B54E8BD|nr:DNA polymerase IV [Butyrivibrio sp.]MBP3782219.1 DNA polymerase IV [Butyrivibrio sp.]
MDNNHVYDYDKYIFHIDVNSAFLSWSALKKLREDPDGVDLRTIPSAVGGDVKKRHGIITAKSIPAKKYGIVTGEPVVKALEKCPHLVLVQSDFNTYREYSHAFIDILNKYSPLVQQMSIDEAFVDISGLKEVYGYLETQEYPYPICLAKKIKDEIRDSLGFTVNVGISCNKLLSKMASDFTKPDRIHTLFPEEIQDKMWPLPIGDLFGCGKQTAARLQNIGIRTIGDAATSDPEMLISFLGANAGSYIYRSANGFGSAEVTDTYEDAKSYSNETTLKNDLNADGYDKDIVPILKFLSEKVSGRLKRDNVYGRTITVSVKTGNFKRHSAQLQLESSICDEQNIYKYSKELCDKLLLGDEGLFIKGETVRLVGVGVSKLDDGSYQQLSLFDNNMMSQGSNNSQFSNTPNREKQKKLDAMTEKLKKEFGKDIIKKGHL